MTLNRLSCNFSTPACKKKLWIVGVAQVKGYGRVGTTGAVNLVEGARNGTVQWRGLTIAERQRAIVRSAKQRSNHIIL